MTSKQDYYDILGVARDANDDALKRAFRQLARRYHPDVNKDPSAEARFKEVSEAYEVLSDPEKRRVYDQYGHAGLGGQDFGGFGDFSSFGDIFEQFDSLFGNGARPGRRGAQRGTDLRYDLQISFEEAVFGAERTIELPRYENCPTCKGSGAEPGTEPTRCPQCGGSGEQRQVQQSVFGQFVNVSACSRCNGEGRIVTSPCRECRGQGRIQTTRSLNVKIPAGVDSNQQIRLTGEGESGPKGGPAGNLYVVLTVKAHRDFKREGSDLYYDLPISFAQAALGDEVTVPTIEGSERLTIPAGTQTGKTFRLRHHGVPNLRGTGRGDQFVTAVIRTPTNVSGRERQIFEELATLEEHKITPNERGFFDKVKDTFGR